MEFLDYARTKQFFLFLTVHYDELKSLQTEVQELKFKTEESEK